MQMPEQNYDSNERRKHSRLFVYSFMHATATLSDSVSTEQKDRGTEGLCWTGLLEDISYDGAQIVLPTDSREHLREHQDVTVSIKTTFLEKLDFDVTARVRYIVPAQTHNGVQVGVQFRQLDKNQKAHDAIIKICEYGQKLEDVSETQSEQMTCPEN
jgi:hypothetical protein